MTIIEQLKEELENEQGITLGEAILPYVREAISTAKREALLEVVEKIESIKDKLLERAETAHGEGCIEYTIDDIITHLESELTHQPLT